MQKLKEKNNNYLLDYELFLKNNHFKKNKFKLKIFFFENYILYKSKKLNLNRNETNNFNNFFLVNTNNLLKQQQKIYTIDTEYQNQLFLNFKLNYNIISFFHKFFFERFIKKNKKIIKGKIIGYDKKYKILLIYIFGCILPMSQKNLSFFYNNKKKIFKSYLLKKKKKSDFSSFFWKKARLKRIIKLYILRDLNFNINTDWNKQENFNEYSIIKINKQKLILSRISYVEKLIRNEKLKFNKNIYKKKRNFSRKLCVQKNKKK